MTMEERDLNPRSRRAFARAAEVIAGGVNSPVRAFRAVGGTPPFIARGAGSRVYDIDGREYIDYVLSWGPLIAGHAHPDVVAAVQRQAQSGTSFGAPTEIETELAEEVRSAYPSMERLRMVNSGTEATMSALRLARAFTGRPRIVKCAGCYHGHPDGLLIRAGSGVATLGLPDSPGVPPAVAELTLAVPYNDLAAMRRAFADYGGEIAAVIVEPVAGNMGLVPPREGYLRGLREITRGHGALLIFDEVMTGFRVSFDGAQERFGIVPDLTTLGKVIGGGLPVGAYGGRREIMDLIAPDGPVYQAGTLSGNPLAMAAGLATIRLLRRPDAYARLEDASRRLTQGLAKWGEELGIPLQTAYAGAMFGFFFAAAPVFDYASARASDAALYARFHGELLRRGVYLAPSQLEAGFVSLAHSDEDVERTLAAAGEALAEAARGAD